MVPVIDKDQKPLMPCSEKRARRMIESRKATPFWRLGIFSIRLNQEPSARNTQDIALAIDPGSKRHGLTLMSHAHTLLNIQATAVTWVKERMEIRKALRRARRFRNTPCRQNRMNRARGGLTPSTKARHDLILRIVGKLKSIYPISKVAIEDIMAVTKKGAKRWNTNFSPLEVGKKYLYDGLRDLIGEPKFFQGYDTFQLREELSLKKTKEKLKEVFEAHCVDSWVMARDTLKRELKAPENIRLQIIVPIQLHRRQLHRMQFQKGHRRPRYGGTRSLGFKRGSLVHHPKYGIAYIGGHSENTISLHSIVTGKRITTYAKSTDCKFKSFGTLRSYISGRQKLAPLKLKSKEKQE